MPERYRDVLGRLVSRAEAPNLLAYFREVYDAGTRRTISRELIETSGSNWEDTIWTGGGVIRTANGEPLTDDALNDMPGGTASFQVRFIMPDNPDYPRGWASYSTLDSSEWENIYDIVDAGEQKGALGVGAIIFHQYI